MQVQLSLAELPYFGSVADRLQPLVLQSFGKL